MTNDAKQGGGVAYRLGWVLYWTCLALVGLWLVWGILIVVALIDYPYSDPPYTMTLSERDYTGDFSERDYTGDFLEALVIVGVPAVALYALGRAFRYVLSGE